MLILHNKDFTAKYGTINSVVEAFVEEERNGLFELSFIMLNTDSLFNYVKEDNIVVANANNTLVNQKFRIYMTRKLMNNRVEVFARHISFDLMYDYIDNISFENQSCEYALNSLFRSSQFSKHYKGYSDIINAQNYSMSMVNILEAIGGKEGSILDTFGNGAELLRDNENIHVLNKRGYDNSVSIEYKKNLTGFELEEDTTDLVTRILPYARYTPEGGEEVIVKASFVDSPLIANYSHPFVKAIDYTEKFEEGEEVTTSKLIAFAQNEYRDNKVDIPKQNFKIEFIPLSKCVGYEDLEDNISLCDTVTIKDTRYNINTQAKVIKTTFNVLKNRYESMELGEPRTSLGDIIGSNDSSKGEQGPPGPQGPPGADGSIGDFPDSLPTTPIVTTKVYGFANIEISWTFENKVYYQYEVYASKEANFTPNNFNLIHSGQTSTYMYQAKPNETWHFKVCAINTHGNRTDFGSAYASTTKIDDLSNYVDEMAINEALIGTMSLDRGWVGELKGNYIDAKQLSVTDGNGKRTLDIDSFGNVSLDVTELKVNSSIVPNGDDIAINLLPNTNFAMQQDKYFGWEFWTNGNAQLDYNNNGVYLNNEGAIFHSNDTSSVCTITSQKIPTHKGEQFTVSMDMYIEQGVRGVAIVFREFRADNTWEDFRVWSHNGSYNSNNSGRVVGNHTIQRSSTNRVAVLIWNDGCYNIDLYHCVYLNRVMLERGNVAHSWRLNNNDKDIYKFSEIYQTNDRIQSTVSSIQGDYVGQSQLTQTVNNFEYKFQQSCANLLYNSSGRSGAINPWWHFEYSNGYGSSSYVNNDAWLGYETGFTIHQPNAHSSTDLGIMQSVAVTPGRPHTLICYIAGHRCGMSVGVTNANNNDYISHSGHYGDILGGTNLSDWHKITLHFTPSETQVHVRLTMTDSSGGNAYMWVKRCMLVEGTVSNIEWSPNPSEVMNNVTNISSEGIRVSHDNGSYSRMNNTEFYQANESGNRTLSIRYGGTRYYKWQHGLEYVGGTAVTRVGTNDEYGINMFGTGHSNYLDLGFASNAYGDTTASIAPWIRLKHWEDGIYIYKQLLSRVQFRRGFQVLRSDNGSWGGTTFVPDNTYKYCVAGDQILSLGNIIGYDEGGDVYTTDGVFTISRDENIRLNSWGHWNFHWWTMYNMNTATVLNAQSEYLRSRHKDINEVYGTKTTDNREIRCKGKNEYTCIGETIIEIPQIIAENIQDDYQVHISKYGFGDYYIKERNPYYFVIEADREFSFDWEVVATQIEKPQAYTVIASEPYKSNVCENPNNEQEDLELHSRYALMNDDEIEIELLKEKNELYKLYAK